MLHGYDVHVLHSSILRVEKPFDGQLSVMILTKLQLRDKTKYIIAIRGEEIFEQKPDNSRGAFSYAVESAALSNRVFCEIYIWSLLA